MAILARARPSPTRVLAVLVALAALVAVVFGTRWRARGHRRGPGARADP